MFPVECLHGVTAEDDNGENAEHGAEGDEGAEDCRHDNAEHPVFAPGNETPRHRGGNGHSLADEDKHSADKNEKPADESRRRRPLGTTVHESRICNHHHSDGDMNEGKAGEESSEARHDVVKNAEKVQLLFILASG